MEVRNLDDLSKQPLLRFGWQCRLREEQKCYHQEVWMHPASSTSHIRLQRSIKTRSVRVWAHFHKDGSLLRFGLGDYELGKYLEDIQSKLISTLVN